MHNVVHVKSYRENPMTKQLEGQTKLILQLTLWVTLPRKAYTKGALCEGSKIMGGRGIYSYPILFSQLFYFKIPHSTCKQKPLLPSTQGPRLFLTASPWMLIEPATTAEPYQVLITSLCPPGSSRGPWLSIQCCKAANCHWSSWWYQWKEESGAEDVGKDRSPEMGSGWEWWGGHAMGIFLTSFIATQPIFFPSVSCKWQSQSILKSHGYVLLLKMCVLLKPVWLSG